MNKKYMASIVIFLAVACMVQGTLWMNQRMLKTQADASKAEQAVQSSNVQLNLEKSQMESLRSNSKELIEYLHVWQPYFAAVDSSQNAELKISLKIKEDNLLSLSQRYTVVAQKNPTLPRLMRADVTFEDGYARLLNWLGRLEAELPTMRISSIRLLAATNPGDLKVSVVMEQPILGNK